MGDCCRSCDDHGTCDGAPPVELPEEIVRSPEGDARMRVARVANRLGLAVSEVNACEGIEVGPDTMVRVDVEIINLFQVARVELRLEISLDRVNWTAVAEAAWSNVGYASVRVVPIDGRFVRLYYTAIGTAGGSAVFGATVRLSKNFNLFGFN